MALIGCCCYSYPIVCGVPSTHAAIGNRSLQRQLRSQLKAGEEAVNLVAMPALQADISYACTPHTLTPHNVLCAHNASLVYNSSQHPTSTFSAALVSSSFLHMTLGMSYADRH